MSENQTTVKTALITGITGQDGSYLAEFLLDKGYQVHGVIRHSSVTTTQRIQHLLDDEDICDKSLFLHYGDLSDTSVIARIVKNVQPDEIYNLAAVSHVKVSFAQPEYSSNVNALGALRILESILLAGIETKTRFYQASTSELFGLVQETPQTERTPFYPRSPYAVAKLFAYWSTVNYREAHGLYACNGILFNHESPRRGEEFVTRKITKALTRIKTGIQQDLRLGNLDAMRDWGHARDYVEMQWLMLQQDSPRDYVIATGVQHSVRDFVNITAREIGMEIRWEGSGVDEKGFDKETGRLIVSVDPAYFRPSEVETLLGNAQMASDDLGWKPRITFEELVRDMVAEDMKNAELELSLRRNS